jgi:hypothetical protein
VDVMIGAVDDHEKRNGAHNAHNAHNFHAISLDIMNVGAVDDHEKRNGAHNVHNVHAISSDMIDQTLSTQAPPYAATSVQQCLEDNNADYTKMGKTLDNCYP